jgi:hypothetical protein
MPSSVTRRGFLVLGSLGLPLSSMNGHAFAQTAAAAPGPGALDGFPRHPPELAREMVGVSHGNLKRVQEIVDARPALARAAIDWGFGDWEDALGAASHVGNRPIAEYLIAHGARPSIFSATMLGQLDVVKAFVAAQPGIQRIPGPHSIPLLAHAKAGGAAAAPVLQYLQSLGDADAPPTAPISDDERASLAGTYVFGSGANDRIEVTFDKGALMFLRKGTTARGLVHVGDRAFHPIGAAAVRIRFTAAATRGMTLTVHDPDLVVTARREPVV